MASSKLSVLIVGLLVLSLVMLVASTENPINEPKATCVSIGVPCKSDGDCFGPCGRFGSLSTCKPDGCCCFTS
ncbi:unnamed protein product [Musa acuminata subsp. malaccensis]|uniref:(wild Malaysian banana) hypothetical protein n=1 Tax=Musa acuminata subsp. malaccensis TaxID=214687 RepID=A0A804L915_MUSAM|nr:unnamed protein product [Musa acuminata subsp. malaccensis]